MEGNATAGAVQTDAPKQPRERGSGRIWKRGPFYWIQYYDDRGRQRRETTHSGTLEVARRVLRRRLGEKEAGLLPDPKANRVTVDELFQDELDYLKKNRKQTGWVKICWDLRLKDFFGGRKAREIRRADLEAYQSHRMTCYRKEFPDAHEAKISACESAVNKDLAVLRMILYRGHTLEKLDAVPPFPAKLQGAMERCGTITEEQFSAMLADCRENEGWLKTLLTMAYTWGYRLRELLKLRCIQVSLAEGIVYLMPRTTKNKHARAIPVSDGEASLLRECMAGKNPEDAVFTRANGAPVTDFRHRWDELVEVSKAGHFEIDSSGTKTWVRAIFHDFRRTAVTNMLAGGMPPENVRALVGHLSKEMTDRYNRPAMDTLRQARELAATRLAALRVPRPVAESHRIENGDNSGTVTKREQLIEAQVL